ncbi:MAG: ExeM/NucH family extracellular endonuclease, partial [Actinomycetota bacterium]|nr:ExeM/NucH family extracellular endonuclease [Actinomycetota bacterium]
YGGANYFETAPAPSPSATTAILRGADGATDTDNNSSDFVTGVPNPRNCGEACVDAPPPPPLCEPPPSYEIAQVQGTGFASPLVGSCVRVSGVVTGDFNDASELGGFYMQDDTPDTDPLTSDGIFVASTTPVIVGDRVTVDGTAMETFGETQLTSATVAVIGTGSIAPAVYDLPRPAGTTFEPVEGVLLTFPETLTATEHFQLGRFGEVAVSSDGRLYQPTDRVAPGPEAQAMAAQNRLRRLLLDDGSAVQNPTTLPYLEPEAVRIGDTASGVTGVLGFGFSSYRLQPTAPIAFARTNPRPAAPDEVGGDIQVASFNALNYFTTLTTENRNARGANSEAEFARQQIKEVEAILGIDADILGLMEIENNGDEAIASLVGALNEEAGAGTYAYIVEPSLNPPNVLGGTFGTDAIKVAIIYRPAAVTPVGAAQTSADPIFDRPPLVQTFERVGGSEPVTVVVNHFKSKNCGTGAPGDADQGDGQGCFNARRVLQAEALVALLDTLAVPNPLVIGDLNAYTEEDPIHVIEDAGYVGLSEQFMADDDRYSYVFDGFSGELDHALAGPDLVDNVTGATIWHINADEPLILDYNLDFGRDPNLFEANPYRTSDHDPLIVGLDLRADSVPAAPVVSVVAGWNAATVTWEAPDDGGQAITGYELRVLQGTTEVASASVGPDVRSHTFGDLDNGVTYRFEVVATNGLGAGPAGAATARPFEPPLRQHVDLDAEAACPGFTVTNSNAYPVGFEWTAASGHGSGVVAAGETVVVADAGPQRWNVLLLFAGHRLQDAELARCR